MGKSVRKNKVERPYNQGTMTVAGFFGMIRQNLRKASRYWKPTLECKKRARRKSQSSNKRLKWEFQCNECKQWFPEKEISVDHIIECGALRSFDDLGDFAKRLFVEVDGLQVLCKEHHDIKTKQYRDKLKEEKDV